MYVHTQCTYIVHVCAFTCFDISPSSANLPMPYLTGVNYCDPLGDQNVWGTVFQLQQPVPEIIMLATKVHVHIHVHVAIPYGGF